MQVAAPIRVPVLFAWLAWLPGCGGGPTTDASLPGLPTIAMLIGSQTFTLEVASTYDTREHGLMDRKSMPADHGMLFTFPRQRPLNFWMKNTLLPLDIVFVNEDRRVVSIQTMDVLTTQPASDNDIPTYPSYEPAKYAIELNAGTAARCGLKAGNVLDIPASAQSATN